MCVQAATGKFGCYIHLQQPSIHLQQPSIHLKQPFTAAEFLALRGVRLNGKMIRFLVRLLMHRGVGVEERRRSYSWADIK